MVYTISKKGQRPHCNIMGPIWNELTTNLGGENKYNILHGRCCEPNLIIDLSKCIWTCQIIPK